ncbi:Wobble nucleotide-excising tRNase [Flavobacterium micromati]|uniref:Wobble nucleotide-excising tRNase n=1 Tax=Flavobacterium micromati TaxID=229205 RepID=A0A1M5MY64_9FLAO|nr:AAA family ATPase [Flavobacterium micromati]SHG82280.1 Wobble nucleotide-excising tRNase [Flavobacterium micromati]
MLEKIEIKKVASFNDTGIQINGLKKVNFIYGANGCGKTTISNYLHNNSEDKFQNCTTNWKNTQALKTLVYNKEFRERNFGKGKIGGVFTLGEATTEQIATINEKVEELKIIKADGVKKRETLNTQIQKKETLENNFKETSWTKIYKKYETVFKEAFTGSLQKESFKNKLLSEFSTNTKKLETFDELTEKAKTIFGKVPQSIAPINAITFDKIIEIESDPIWKKIIVGKADVDIAKLIQKLNLNDWVNQGRNYIQEDNTCPFCQQKTITDDFKKQLEDYFDETYLSDLNTIKTLKEEYNSLMNNFVNELNNLETNQKSIPETKLKTDRFSAYLKTLINHNTVNGEYLNNKTKEPSRSIELVSVKEQLALISELITNTNEEIIKHNKIVANFTTEKISLTQSIWKYIIEESRTDVVKFNADNNGLQTGNTALQGQLTAKLKEFSDLDIAIKNLSKNVTSIQPTINEINRLLKSYGFLSFKIEPSLEEGFYQIQREDGTIAEATLSEGEITFITFLYYLQLAKGGSLVENVNDERILVIDDPISSLDSNVLFVVSTLIKDIIKSIKSDTGNIKQIILLTHNVYFHKEVSFIDGRTKFCKETNFWILRKNDKFTNIQTFIMENPIKSSYELLWQELKSENVKSSITIQNIMRRIIENYFKLLGKYGDDDLIQKFTTKEEQEICSSLISWINDGSHSINDDLFVELQDRTIENYKKVFKDIFKLTNHEGHFNMMMGISELIQPVEEIISSIQNN